MGYDHIVQVENTPCKAQRHSHDLFVHGSLQMGSLSHDKRFEINSPRALASNISSCLRLVMTALVRS